MVESQSQANQAAASGGLAGGAFVGREREMGELGAVLEDALAGRGRLAMLVGEPGISKTRTAQQLAARAETRGAQVLWGWCYEGEGAPPFWPWVQPIRSYLQQRDPQQLRSELLVALFVVSCAGCFVPPHPTVTQLFSSFSYPTDR